MQRIAEGLDEGSSRAWQLVASHAIHFSGPIVEEILIHEGTADALLDNPNLPLARVTRTLGRLSRSLSEKGVPQTRPKTILTNLARSGRLAEFPSLVALLKYQAKYRMPERPEWLRGYATMMYGAQFGHLLAGARESAKILRHLRPGEEATGS